MKVLNNYFYELLTETIHQDGVSKLIATLLTGTAIIVVAYLAFLFVRYIIRKVVHGFAARTKTDWDDILLKNKTFSGLAHLVPASIIYFSANYAIDFYPGLEIYILKFSRVYLMLASIFIVNAFLSSLNEIYNSSFSLSKEKPLAGFIQLLKIFIYFVGFLFFIAIVFNSQLSNLFKGLGAMVAVLLLVFKDTILGFVASIQIMMNDMVKIGDWIEMRSRGAEGTVLEITLTTVKVQNGDKTISMLPTYALISESFVNWRGMEMADGRRIKRSINIDMTSVKFCDDVMLQKFSRLLLIKDYIAERQHEIEVFNTARNIPSDEYFNGRRQTNLGIFRKYLEAYLASHPLINKEMTFVVRHLQPTENGIPLEIMVFSVEKNLKDFEIIQADIFDHVLAIIHEFELQIFQNPSVNDFSKLLQSQK